MQNLVVYDDGELELKVSIKEDTVWLTQIELTLGGFYCILG